MSEVKLNPEIKELKEKVRLMLDSGLSDHQVVASLVAFGKRGQVILHGEPTIGYRDDKQRRQGNKDWSQWANSQQVVDFTHENKLILDKKTLWWMVRDAKTGEVQGLPNSRGVETITNGIVVYLRRGDGSLFLAHRDHFKADRLDSNGERIVKKPKEAKVKHASFLQNLLNELATG